MGNYVITIGREFGCNAREVGRILAAELNVKFYDKELVERASKIAGLPENIKHEKSTPPSIIDNFKTEFGYGITPSYFSYKAVESQAQVIREIANSESCVMLGRCSNYFLRGFENILNVFLYAPISYRIKHISEAYGLKPTDAEKLIKKIDKKRHLFYKYVTGENRGDRNLRDLMIDVQVFGVKGSVELILKAFSEKIKDGD